MIAIDGPILSQGFVAFGAAAAMLKPLSGTDDPSVVVASWP